MVTIVTDVRLKEGAEQQWDAVMRERLDLARSQPQHAWHDAVIDVRHDGSSRPLGASRRRRSSRGQSG